MKVKMTPDRTTSPTIPRTKFLVRVSPFGLASLTFWRGSFGTLAPFTGLVDLTRFALLNLQNSIPYPLPSHGRGLFGCKGLYLWASFWIHHLALDNALLIEGCGLLLWF
ncbi:MAG: hypothetical protein EBV95_04960 [Actinobacteria bacterium]|nr:hypothetical protein [Actinomycetota bacterium]